MKCLDWNSLDARARRDALARPVLAGDAARAQAVAKIIADVRARGDAALAEWTARFDGVESSGFEVGADEKVAAARTLDPAIKRAIDEAAARIERFHAAAMQPAVRVETAPGVVCESIPRPIPRVGLYVPAGSAPLPSTALMLGVPARLAGCDEVVLCTPPQRDGRADAAVLYAASVSGVERVFKLGGVQAIAAMAFGGASVPACDKLFGPGNAWVTEAKRQVSATIAGPAIDMPAGPSEVMVIADGGADPVFVAADLLSQCEHGPDSQAVLVTDDAILPAAVAAEVERQLADLPRADIARRSLANARLIRVDDLAQAFALANAYAPEHLIVAVDGARRWLPAIVNAGSVFLGRWSPESVGDYCSGTNHVLPTYGHARALGGVSVASFQKRVTVQELSPQGLAAIGPCAERLASAEGLQAHARAVAVRLAATVATA